MPKDSEAIYLSWKLLLQNRHQFINPLRISWRCDGKEVLELVVTITEDKALISRFIGPPGPLRLEPIQEIDFTYRHCHFGGSRRYFRCGMPECGRGSMKLILVGDVFVCRKCADLRYASQSTSPLRRLERKVERLAAELGSSRAELDQLQRPKGMWRRTFARRVALLAKAQAELNDANRTLLGRLRMPQKLPAS